MNAKNMLGCAVAGLCAGAVTGLFGAGGGMILVPLLCLLTKIPNDEIFPSSVAIILPICITALLLGTPISQLPFQEALPYLIGSTAGGILSGVFGKKIPTVWLHRILGATILWGGIRYLC